MTKAKNTKRALLTSVLSMMLCMAMLVGSTFAWFTDSVTSGKNRIVAGNLDIEVTHTNNVAKDQPLQDAGDLFPIALWEPGVVSYETFTVTNKGTLAFDYEFNFTASDFNKVVLADKTTTDYNLKDVIQIGVIEGAVAEGMTRQQLVDAVKAVKESDGSVERNFAAFESFKYTDYMQAAEKDGNPAQSEKTFTVVAYWEPNVKNDNDYNVNNGKTVDKKNDGKDELYIDIVVDVQAKQRVYEEDSFGNTYDASADFNKVIPPLTDTNGTSYTAGTDKNGNLTFTSKGSNAAVFTADPESKELTLTSGMDYSGDVTLPAAIAGEDGTVYTLTAIADYALGDEYTLNEAIQWGLSNLNITSVTIPATVKSIGSYAFGSCPKLTSVTIQDGVETIGKGAFRYCENLTSVNIPSSVETIGQDAFSYCKNLTSVTIPDSVTTISDFAFGYTSITEVTIPESLKEIPTTVFCGCDKLTTVEIPNSITKIGDLAFADCTALTSIEIPNSVTVIGSEAFGGSGLESVTIPASVTTIAGNAFAGCKSLTQLIIPNTDTTMDMLYFQGCSALETIVVPRTTNPYVNGAFFMNCGSLKAIYYLTEDYYVGMVENGTSYNKPFMEAEQYVYSETEPTATEKQKKTIAGGTIEYWYWHWNENGEPTPWDLP